MCFIFYKNWGKVEASTILKEKMMKEGFSSGMVVCVQMGENGFIRENIMLGRLNEVWWITAFESLKLAN